MHTPTSFWMNDWRLENTMRYQRSTLRTVAWLILIAACLAACLYATFRWADTIHKGDISPGFDISPSGKKIVFNSKENDHDLLFILDYPSGRVKQLMRTTGSIEEICVLNDHQAVLSVRIQRNRISSDIYAYLVDLNTGAIRRLTKAKRVWETRIDRISSRKFILRQHLVRVYLTPFGWEIYGLEKSALVVNASDESIAPFLLDTSPYFLVQALDNSRAIVLSSYSSHGKRWFLAELDKPVDAPNARIARRQPLPIYSETLVASEDGRFFCYLLVDTTSQSYEIYCFDRRTQQTKRLVVFRNRIVQLKCVGDSLFFLTNSRYASIWRVHLDGSNLRQVVNIGSLAGK